MAERTVSILGATGSIGASTLSLIAANRDRFRIGALTANCQAEDLARLAKEHGAQLAVVADESCLPALRAALGDSGIASAAGPAGLIEAAQLPADIVVSAIVGCAGLAPTMAAIGQGRTVALANKESLVAAGAIMMAAVAEHGTTLLPVDSEHNAIHQCLSAESLGDVRTITLTASGGPFREWSAQAIAQATPAQAVKHPNWSMGAKISVDSATMFNKGLELIEAWHLFPVGLEALRILVHPQSVIHSMVEFRDGSTIAQLGPSDMRVPIANVLAWPERMEGQGARLDLAALGRLDFAASDEARFPATRIARDALAAGGAAPAVLNAANEVAVAAFLAGQIGFTRIAALVETMLEQSRDPAPESLDDVIALDRLIRARANEALRQAA